jgi:glycosyltransferase involved in cell wall biosynthesis
VAIEPTNECNGFEAATTAMKGTVADYVITYRDSGAYRHQNLITVLNWVAHDDRIRPIVIEQDHAPALNPAELPGSCRLRFTRNPGPFNKSWGFNVGARLASADILVLADADMLIDRETLWACIEACHVDVDAVNPYAGIIDLGEQAAIRVHAGDFSVLGQAEEAYGRDRTTIGEHLCFCGGIYIIKRAVFLRLAGQDERFLGWGGEDDAMSLKLEKMGIPRAWNRAGVAFHLYHERRSADIAADPRYHDNLRLLQTYEAADSSEVAALCRSQATTMGDPAKHARRGE